jgi:hypothetical protein
MQWSTNTSGVALELLSVSDSQEPDAEPDDDQDSDAS